MANQTKTTRNTKNTTKTETKNTNGNATRNCTRKVTGCSNCATKAEKTGRTTQANG